MIFLNHLIDNGVDVGALFHVLFHGLGAQVLPIDHLLLDVALQGEQLLLLLEGGGPGVLIGLLLSAQVLDVDSCILLLIYNKQRLET